MSESHETDTEDNRVARFEAALEELEGIVERMEDGDQNLERSLADFERGVRLARQCQKALDEAEHKVEILLGEDENERPEPYPEQ